MLLLRYWNRLCTLNESRLLKNVFCKDYREKGHWSSSVEKIFVELDMHYVFQNCNPCNINECKSRLESNYENEWKQIVCRKPKLRSYIIWKDTFGLEPYVKFNSSRCQRAILAQLFTGVELEKRICMHCKEQKIESELHFILECECYSGQREYLFQSIDFDFDECDDNGKLKFYSSFFRDN